MPSGQYRTLSDIVSVAQDKYEESVLKLIQPNRLPQHIAIIMDGNGRWALSRHMPRIFGHRAGMETVRRTLQAARDIGIEFVTLYAFSAENWSRPKPEISALMHLLQEYLRKEVDELDSSNVKLLTIGNISKLPSYAKRELDCAIERLSKNDGQKLVLALNYGSRDEIITVAKRIGTMVANGEIKPGRINFKTIEDNLYTKGIPDPDLLIRTSGELRISNFLLWQMAYTEFYITETLWPDFSRVEFFKAVLEYQKRDRRFGCVKASS